ncbi:MAG: bifunctional 23S rRNA (guanine(2069)-N(7))-methyltransferase RlmK/23S rRNA (guanine(2445)-N(2))-methyltransferase RlmL, partial [Bacilli bacterium]
LAAAYRFCLYSRVASRLMLGLAQDEGIYDADAFYESSMQIPWETWLDPTKTFTVTVTAMNCPWLKKSTFAAIRLKDAIVDRQKEHFDGERSSVEFDNPDVTFHVHLERDAVTWHLDFSGRSLHKRGYREGDTGVILKENLAAAVLLRSDWYKTVLDNEPALLLDPFCGSGTIPIEAALMATDTAPGLLDPHRFAFLKLNLHDPDLWEEVLEEAYDRHENGLKRDIKILGWDKDPEAIRLSKAHARKAGVEDHITFEVKDFTEITEDDVPEGMNYAITDPPYGIRMVEPGMSIESLYLAMGKQFNTIFPGWKVSILCGDKELLSYVDMKPERTNTLYNGPIEAQLAHYQVFTREVRQAILDKIQQRKAERLSEPLSEGAEMAYNRLKKNLTRLKPLMEAEGVTSYRIYDADMPEYSAAIDFYEGKYIHLQEYAAPSSIDEEDAQRRLDELIQATERATEIDLEWIFIKQRREQKGKSQYEKLASASKFYIMRENKHMFMVNFNDYLDTGIFLDHRPVRKMIQEMAENKRFLNLFCYTGTATVYAAAGGALSTVSVDASATYLDWAMKNMQMNGFDGMNHFYYKEDCIEWLRATYDTYDLIFCDPPTFSNSKMRDTFDVARDHPRLIHSTMRHLAQEGTLIFSTNFRKFSLHPAILEEYQVQEITEQTIGEDFARNQKIHYCWLIKHRKAVVKMQPREVSKPVRRVVRKK